MVGRGKARSTRGRALAGVAGASILLALAAVTMAVQKSGPNRLLQLGPVQISNIEINHLRRAVEPFTNLAHKTMAKAMTFPALMLGDAKSSAPHAKPLRAVAEPAEQPVKSFDSGVVYYYMPPASGNGAKLAKTAANAAAVEAAAFGHSKLQHLAAASQILAAPPPGVVVAPNVGGAPTCDIWTLQTLSDSTQKAWDKCINNKNYKEPNSIAQEIFDELDETRDGEVTPQEYCKVARKHTARLTDEQCKEIIKLMDKAAGDNNGVLSYPEFKEAYLKGQEPPEAAEERRRRRHLLSWVWVPDKGESPKNALNKALKKKQDAEVFATSTLATFSRAAVSMDTCKHEALGDTCNHIGKCSQPVCSRDTMYNDTKIEALCGMCTLAGETGSTGGFFGCFAVDSLVDVHGKGRVEVAQVAVGDRIRAASSDGSLVFSRVVFTHAHFNAMETVKLSVGGDVMELTGAHQVPVFTEECGASYCAAAKLVKAQQVKVGNRLYVSNEGRSCVATVTAIAKGQAHVKYIVTEAGNLVVNGVVASVFSTLAKHLETLPFLVLDSLFPDIFEWAPVKAALYSVLESPALRGAEGLIDMFMSFKAPAAPQHRVVMGLTHARTSQ